MEDGKAFTRQHMCDKFFVRGQYEEWKQENGTGNYIRKQLFEERDEKFLRKWIKAQFLRFACPLNYVMTPLPVYQRSGVKLSKNDIGEEPKFQRFAQYKFKQRYGELFDKYCEYLMLAPDVEGEDCGNTVIKLEYSLKIGEENKRKNVLTRSNVTNFIEYLFADKLEHCRQSLLDDEYWTDYVGLSKAVCVTRNGEISVRKVWEKEDVEQIGAWLKEELSYLEEAENEEDVLGMFIREFNENGA